MQQSKIYHGGGAPRRTFALSGGSSSDYGVQGIRQEITYDILSAAALTNSVIIFFGKIPPGAIVIGARIKVDTVWGGGAITEVYLSLGVLGREDEYIHEYRADNIVPAHDEYAESFLFQSESYNNNVDRYFTARSVGANLSALTQGTAMVELYFLKRVTA